MVVPNLELQGTEGLRASLFFISRPLSLFLCLQGGSHFVRLGIRDLRGGRGWPAGPAYMNMHIYAAILSLSRRSRTYHEEGRYSTLNRGSMLGRWGGKRTTQNLPCLATKHSILLYIRDMPHPRHRLLLCTEEIGVICLFFYSERTS